MLVYVQKYIALKMWSLTKNSHIPATAKNVTIGNGYDLPLPDLPNTIIRLDFGLFDIELKDSTLPRRLEYLDLGFRYSHMIRSSLFPGTLRTLILSYVYDKCLKVGSLPKNLVKLSIGYMYEHDFDPNIFPDTLKILIINTKKAIKFNEQTLPPHLEKLSLCDGYSSELTRICLPPTISKLSMRKIDANDIKFLNIPTVLAKLAVTIEKPVELKFDMFPEYLEILHITAAANLCIIGTDSFPIGLIKLRLEGKFNESIHFSMFPQSLTHLKLVNYNPIHLDEFSFPESLESLELANYKCHVRENLFPANLKSLDIRIINHADNNCFPRNLRILKLDYANSAVADGLILPDSLKYLEMSRNIFRGLHADMQSLPSSLEYICVNDIYLLKMFNDNPDKHYYSIICSTNLLHKVPISFPVLYPDHLSFDESFQVLGTEVVNGQRYVKLIDPENYIIRTRAKSANK